MRKVVKKKNSTTKKLPTILGTELAYEYVRTNPVTEEFINNVCNKLREYSRGADALFIGCFIRDMNLPHRTFYNWLESGKWPQLNEAVEDAKKNIGFGRIQGAAKRHFDKGVIMHSQYRFGEEWKQDDVHQAEMKKSEDSKEQGTINVYTTPVEKVIDREKYKPLKRSDSVDSEV